MLCTFQNLQAIVWLVCLVCLVNVQAGDTLIIRTTYAPDDCDSTRKSINGDRLTVHYVASIDPSSKAGELGMVFDSSRKRDRTEKIVLGGGKVTKGFSDGMIDMCVGEKRTVIIPPALGFGDAGALPNIPGGTTLRYEIECFAVADPRKRDLLPPGNAWVDIDRDENWIATFDEVLSYWVNKRGQKDIPNNLFEKDDKNKDGVVSWEEFGGPKGSQGPPDWNGDEIVPNNPRFPPLPSSPPIPAPVGPAVVRPNAEIAEQLQAEMKLAAEKKKIEEKLKKAEEEKKKAEKKKAAQERAEKKKVEELAKKVEVEQATSASTASIGSDEL